MAGPNDFTGNFVSSTFQRLLQLSGSGEVTDGTGSLVSFLPITVSNSETASYVPGITVFDTGSLLVTASVSSNTITFTKGNGSTFPITVNTGSGGSGTTFPYTGSAIISGSLTVTGSVYAPSITGSLYGTASWAINALTASYALQAQNATTANVADSLYIYDNSSLESNTNFPLLVTATPNIAVPGEYTTVVENQDFLYNPTGPVFAMPNVNTIYEIGDKNDPKAQLVIYGEVKANKFTTLVSTLQFVDLITTGSRPNILTLSVANNNLIVSGGHISSSFTGSLFGTSSWATNALTASFVTTAQTASYILNAVSSSFALTASYAMNAGSSINTGSLVTTASFNSFTSSYTTGSFTGSFTGSLLGTATTASYAIFNPYIVTIGTRIYTDDTSITAGFKGYKHVGYNANIIKTRTIANTSGSIDINVKRSGTTLGTISLSNQSASLDTTLTGWTTQLSTDDLLEFHVSQSSTYITDISIFIDIQARQ